MNAQRLKQIQSVAHLLAERISSVPMSEMTQPMMELRGLLQVLFPGLQVASFLTESVDPAQLGSLIHSGLPANLWAA